MRERQQTMVDLNRSGVCVVCVVYEYKSSVVNVCKKFSRCDLVFYDDGVKAPSCTTQRSS
jgi:hypothetical protein